MEKTLGESYVDSGFQTQLGKMEVAAQDRAGWTEVVCGLCSTGSDKA